MNKAQKQSSATYFRRATAEKRGSFLVNSCTCLTAATLCVFSPVAYADMPTVAGVSCAQQQFTPPVSKSVNVTTAGNYQVLISIAAFGSLDLDDYAHLSLNGGPDFYKAGFSHISSSPQNIQIDTYGATLNEVYSETAYGGGLSNLTVTLPLVAGVNTVTVSYTGNDQGPSDEGWCYNSFSLVPTPTPSPPPTPTPTPWATAAPTATYSSPNYQYGGNGIGYVPSPDPTPVR